MSKIITKQAIDRREYWVEEVRKLSGSFVDDSTRLEKNLPQKSRRIVYLP